MPLRPPAHVYRLRRALAATGVVLVLFSVLNLFGVVGGGGTPSSATTTTSGSTTSTLATVPTCTIADVPVLDDPATAWATVLIDTARSVPQDFGPTDLHNISDAGFPFTAGVAVRSLVINDLAAMRKAAIADHVPLTVVAAYRSYSQQTDLYARRVDKLGNTEAGSRVARPGHSEHQLGTAIDLTSAGLTDVDSAWGSTPQGQWVATTAYKYGFLLSYPLDASARTCYDYEPWHLRYVGRDEAAKVIASGLSLREYLWQLHPVDIAAGATTSTTTSTTVTTTRTP